MATIGIDIGGRTHVVARCRDGQPRADREILRVGQSRAGFAAFDAWLERQAEPVTLVTMESSGHYWMPLASHLCRRDVPVAVVNPLAAKYFARSRLARTKSDPADARSLAEMAMRDTPPVRDPLAGAELRQAARFAMTLVTEQARVCQRLIRLVELGFPELGELFEDPSQRPWPVSGSSTPGSSSASRAPARSCTSTGRCAMRSRRLGREPMTCSWSPTSIAGNATSGRRSMSSRTTSILRVAVWFCDEELLSSCERHWDQLVDLAKAAESWLRRHRRRVKEGLAAKLASKRDPGGRPPFGFRRNSGKLIEPDPDHLEVGRTAFSLALESLTDRAIAARLGLPLFTVRGVLTSPLYVGRLRDGGPANWPPVIDVTTWNAVAQIRAARSRRTPGRPETRRTYLLPMLECEACGRRLVGDKDRYRDINACEPFRAVAPQPERPTRGQHARIPGQSYPRIDFESLVPLAAVQTRCPYGVIREIPSSGHLRIDGGFLSCVTWSEGVEHDLLQGKLPEGH